MFMSYGGTIKVNDVPVKIKIAISGTRPLRYYPIVTIGGTVAKGFGVGDSAVYPSPSLALASAFEWLAAQLEYPFEYFRARENEDSGKAE